MGSPIKLWLKYWTATLVSEFELQSRYYIHFRSNTLGKGVNLPFPQDMGKKLPLLFFSKEGFDIK